MATTLTYTALDVATEALRDAGVVSIEHAPTAEELDIAFKRLNMMLKALQNDSITLWKQTDGTISVTAATASYTLPSRPLTIGTVNYKESTNETWLYRMGRQEYFELPDRTSAGRPTQFYYHRQREQGVLYVWPVLATATGTLVYTARDEVEDITAGDDVVDCPAEWYEAIHWGLAWRLSVAFGVENPGLQQKAERAKMIAQGADVEESFTFMAAEE